MTTLQTVLTSFVSVNGLRIAYRRFGAGSPLPLVYVNHLRGSMDTLDPLLFNSIAKAREVIVYDSAGIGHSEGTVPDSIPEMAEVLVNLLATLDIPKADLIGFSMGGGIVQHIGYSYPQLVNKLILAGTQPGIGEGVTLPPREVLESAGANIEQPPTEDDMMYLFFNSSETSLALGHAWWKRIHERNVEGEPRKAYLTGTGTQSQLAAIFKYTTDTRNFDRLAEIKAPVLVTNGHTDIMSPTANSFMLQQKIPNAQLHLYADAGHGHLFQVPELYGKQIELFLNN
ncbi:hypothetical protein N7481_009449 [Penicillium waksmanii]|uniref:uncharacterized protein n=1 Tax=Penicillium waksmanii TaxID=69791 RepID=UPI002547941B|nr:uncharacterized protein N7481_009449 [Penicillium waksmanii]KAJ5975742.1 hypothetical protein N7481_009449 [Penicillium waksmanii]